MTTARRPTKIEGRLDFEVNQVSHGFTVGTPIYHNGTSYAASSAASTTTGEVIAVVSEVKDTDNFTALPAGRLRNLSGLTAGSVYFLSETAGQVTTTSPTISKPVYFAVSTTEAVILPYRGGTGTGGLALDNLSDVNAPSPSDNDILTYDSVSGEWINEAPSGGGDMVLISTATASNNATIEFTGIDNTYSTYLIVGTNIVPATNAVRLLSRTSSNNGSSYDNGLSNYQYRCYSDASGTPSGTGSGQEIDLSHASDGGLSNTAANGSDIRLFLYNPSDTSTKTMISCQSSMYVSSGIPVGSTCTATRDATSAVDAIQLLMSSGNISTGTFKLYGIT